MTCRLSENSNSRISHWLTSLVRSVLTGITPQSLRQKCNPCERTNYQDWECWCTEEFQGSAITARLALKAHICGFCGAPKSQKAVVEVVFLRTSGSSAPALCLLVSWSRNISQPFGDHSFHLRSVCVCKGVYLYSCQLATTVVYCKKKTHNFQIDSHTCAIFIGHEPKACWLTGGVAVGVAFYNKAEWILEVHNIWSLGAAAFFSCNKQLFISFCGSISSSTKLFPPKSNCSFLSMKISFAAGVKHLWGCVCVNAGTPGCLHVRGRSYGEFALVFRMLENLQFCDN